MESSWACKVISNPDMTDPIIEAVGLAFAAIE